MSDLTLSPSARTKRKTIEAANKIKHGSPKLHQVLRQRCRERMRERRDELFNGRRLGLDSPPDDVQETLSTILRKEFDEIISADLEEEPSKLVFDDPLELEEAIQLEAEIMVEEEQWIFEEYCRQLEREEEESMSEEVVFCPICLKTALVKVAEFINCKKCDIYFPTLLSLTEFKDKLSKVTDDHMLHCTKPPIFTVMPDSSVVELFICCETCHSFSPVY
ncbi:RPA-interacting protein-like [Leptopilina heterotoma]|uniref:RPA-interacting protein-like n=1 Tax=Leptopilina heterotoma TaxID=63436 RepID=UPI001CA8CE2A|nr:RPA-interacting protein-like [Leptopilina heterotoma]XP_043471987.1 RPA-interacting protein-like [Leptopilina heterotoma]XP_043471988.1 RPA-interacting protein-like [Leptopilina heterotoma]XP_043471989.1 RPA-interacting protein-like [Leptopilina heterotoma]